MRRIAPPSPVMQALRKLEAQERKAQRAEKKTAEKTTKRKEKR